MKPTTLHALIPSQAGKLLYEMHGMFTNSCLRVIQHTKINFSVHCNNYNALYLKLFIMFIVNTKYSLIVYY